MRKHNPQQMHEWLSSLARQTIRLTVYVGGRKRTTRLEIITQRSPVKLKSTTEDETDPV